MKKLDKDLYIKHAKRLNAILDDKSTFLSFLNRSDFKQTIQNELNVLSACEKLFPNIDLEAKLTSKSLVKQFNKATKENFKLDEKFKYEDETDLIDAINYLATFCNNMFKVNLDDLVAGKNVTATDPKIDLRAKPEMDDDAPRMNRNFAFAAGGIPLASTPYENPYFVGKAYAKLTDDMKQGKFYQYKTKPQVIPIMKWICVIGLMLIGLGALIAAILIFMASSLTVTDGEETAKISAVFGTIGSGVMYILLAGFSAYPIYIMLKGLLGKNLNTKYNFSWGFVAVFILLTIIVVLPDMRSTWLNPYNFSPDQPVQAMAAYYGWKTMYIVILSCLAFVLIPMVVGAICNPRPDPDAIEKKVREYIDLFSAESGSNPVPPKADVQKPTDVKPSKSKDSKKKK
ncbi:MAG: hypothetical protein ACOQNV_02575 [Mycoplasmoidaceae bacterium]